MPPSQGGGGRGARTPETKIGETVIWIPTRPRRGSLILSQWARQRSRSACGFLRISETSCYEEKDDCWSSGFALPPATEG
jgi:hypothetical protein